MQHHAAEFRRRRLCFLDEGRTQTLADDLQMRLFSDHVGIESAFGGVGQCFQHFLGDAAVRRCFQIKRQERLIIHLAGRY